MLQGQVKDNPNHWWVAFIRWLVLPHAPVWAALIQVGELLVALGYFGGVALWLSTSTGRSGVPPVACTTRRRCRRRPRRVSAPGGSRLSGGRVIVVGATGWAAGNNGICATKACKMGEAVVGDLADAVPIVAAGAADLGGVIFSRAQRDARERHRRACARTLEARSWQQRLAPLAQLLVDRRLVRRRNEHGAPVVRRLKAEMLRETMCRLLREGDDSAYLVFELVVEGTDPQRLAAERGVSLHVLTEQLCTAVQCVASAYEARAYAGAVSEPGLVGAMRTSMGDKRSS